MAKTICLNWRPKRRVNVYMSYISRKGPYDDHPIRRELGDIAEQQLKDAKIYLRRRYGVVVDVHPSNAMVKVSTQDKNGKDIPLNGGNWIPIEGDQMSQWGDFGKIRRGLIARVDFVGYAETNPRAIIIGQPGTSPVGQRRKVPTEPPKFWGVIGALLGF